MNDSELATLQFQFGVAAYEAEKWRLRAEGLKALLLAEANESASPLTPSPKADKIVKISKKPSRVANGVADEARRGPIEQLPKR